MGDATLILSMLPWAWSMASLALFRFSSASEMEALIRCAARLDVLLQLRKHALGLVQGEIIFAGIDGADQFIFLYIQLSAPYVEPGFQESDFVLSRHHFRIGLGLGDLLFGLQQLGAILIKLEMLLARIKLHHQFAFLDGLSGVQQVRELQGAPADGRRNQHFRMAGAQFAGDDRPSCRDRRASRSPVGTLSPATAGEAWRTAATTPTTAQSTTANTAHVMARLLLIFSFSSWISLDASTP